MLVCPVLAYNHLLTFLFCHSCSDFFFRQAFQSLSHYSDASEAQVVGEQILLTIYMHGSTGFWHKMSLCFPRDVSGAL